MHILIITPHYAPDLGPSAPLFTMLSQGLVLRGHQVTVIAMVPHYPTGRVPAEFKGRWIWRSLEDGVEVVRVAIPSMNRSNLSKRMLQFVCYQLGAAWAVLGQKNDVAIVTNPAMESWLPFTCQVIFRHKPAIFSVHDVYPDVGIKMGIFRHKPVIAVIAGLERFCLNHSAIVRILSDSFRPGLCALGVPDNKMALVYDWVDTELIHPMPHENAFAQEHDLSHCFVVLYAGNIGLSQGLEHILKAAELLADQKDIRFVFVGDGSGRASLQSQAEKQQLSNVQFLSFQPRQRLPEVLACADVSLVILKRGIGFGSLPSKTFSIFASGRPILASVDEESETWKLVERAEAGLCVPPEDPSKIAEAILNLKQDKNLCDRLGSNGRKWAEQHHSPQYAAEQFERLLIEAIATQKPE
jgi:colanic acid biosynthesis glycosyl transferase WcaI